MSTRDSARHGCYARRVAKRGDGQLGLFGGEAPPPRTVVGAAHVPAELHAVAARLPAEVRLGTSSWSFPGWTGLVWDQAVPPATLARDGLAAYARHPLLRAVGVDRTFYAPVAVQVFAAWAASVPPDFRFLVKAHELVTSPRVSGSARHGAQAGAENARFLDPAWALEVVVEPARAGLGVRLGPILFQLPPLDARTVGGEAGFARRLEAFLAALPAGPLYAVELRTRELLGPAYAAVLAATDAVHCFSVHPSMPPVGRQREVVDAGRGRAVVARWMLRRGLGYEEARARYAPFDRLVDPDRATRDAIADLCREAARSGRPAYAIVNNKAEGSAPRSVFALADRIGRATA